jgi:microcystin-dependent protein
MINFNDTKIAKTRTIANYKAFPNMAFPLECDGLADSQLNDALLSVLGNIGGDKYILAGLTAATNNAGYVFLATQDFPSGELLYVEPATATMGSLCLRKSNENITANDYPYTNAYTKRTLYHGIPSAGVESYALSGFVQLETNAALKQRLDTLKTQVDGLTQTPSGIICMWSGAIANVPQGWALCDGQDGRPDLRGRFIVGYNSDDEDYNAPGKTNSTDKMRSIDASQMPVHNHIQRVSPENNAFQKHPGYRIDTDPGVSADQAQARNNDNVSFEPWVAGNGGSGDGDDFVHTLSAGGGAGIDFRPPYYTLAYIIKL